MSSRRALVSACAAIALASSVGLGAALAAGVVGGSHAGGSHADGRPAVGRVVPAGGTTAGGTAAQPAAPSAAAPASAAAVAASTPARTPSFRPEPVAKLSHLVAPDAFVTAPRPLTSAQLRAVGALPDVTTVAVTSTGTLTAAGHDEPAVGVDPSTFRRVTPAPTAKSDALWAAVANGDLVADFAAADVNASDLGARVAVHALGTREIRLGALAAFELPAAQLVVSTDRGRQLGLTPRSGLAVSAPTVSPTQLVDELAAATGGRVQLLGPDAASQSIGATSGGASSRPQTWIQLFQQSATACPGLSWTVLAAIGQIESGDGANNGPSSKGAIGPMQFLPSTFKEWAVDGDHDGKTNPYDAYDAVPTATRLLCADGAGSGSKGLTAAIFSYNHADWYVADVLALAQRYR